MTWKVDTTTSVLSHQGFCIYYLPVLHPVPYTNIKFISLFSAWFSVQNINLLSDWIIKMISLEFIKQRQKANFIVDKSWLKTRLNPLQEGKHVVPTILSLILSKGPWGLFHSDHCLGVIFNHLWLYVAWRPLPILSKHSVLTRLAAYQTTTSINFMEP